MAAITMPLIKDIISAIEQYAPLSLQEGYDNSGLQVGDRESECTGVLLCVDVTPAVIDEAVAAGANLVISHHPVIFKGLKRLTGATVNEQAVIKAVLGGVAIYSAHTSMDNAPSGVSAEIGRRLGLENMKVLDPQRDKIFKLSVFVPHAHVDRVREALFAAGAGHIGNYDSCSYSLRGEGTFRALDGANPFVGSKGEVHSEPETRVEVIVPAWRRLQVERALIEAHPYEEPAYEFVMTDNLSLITGSGVVGDLSAPLSAKELVESVKEAFGSPVARCSSPEAAPSPLIRRVALCGGAGGFLAGKAIAAGADAFITSDTRYHDFVELANDIFIVDIGHFESEQCTKSIFYRIVTEKFPNFAVQYSKIEKNPIFYL